MATKTTTDALPDIIGGYRVVEKLASGGMGAVLLAQKEAGHGFTKRVAIKVMLPHLLDSAETRALFLDEARLAARLSHPNVCQVFDFGEEQGLFYLAMEYVAGVSVQQMLARPQQDVALAARIVLDAARGLHHAHTLRGDDGRPLAVVHRDVSPQNLVVTWDGTTKVLDFGIAKSREKASATEVGIVRGKPAYMSPEQARGDTLDARSDVFSLGVVLWELVCGRPLFHRDNPYATLKAVVEAPIPDPRDSRPDVELPQPLLDAIRGALARDAARRLSSAAALAQLLEPIAATPEQLAQFLRDRFSAAHAASLKAPALPTESVTPSPPARRMPRGLVAAGAAGVATVTVMGALLLSEEPAPASPRAVADAGIVSATDAGSTVVDAGSAVDAGPAIVDAGSAPKNTGKRPPKPPRPRAVDTGVVAPAAVGTGHVDVWAEPYGSVRIDGVDVGVTPVNKHALPAGPHVIELIRQGRPTEKKNLQVQDGRRVRVEFD